MFLHSLVIDKFLFYIDVDLLELIFEFIYFLRVVVVDRLDKFDMQMIVVVSKQAIDHFKHKECRIKTNNMKKICVCVCYYYLIR